MTKKYDIKPEVVAIPTDQASIEQGKKWASVLCADCHGADFSGKPLVDDKTVGFVPAPNLTPGQGGAGSEFTDANWVLAFRHGVDPHENRAFVGMPSMNFAYLNDQDLGDIIAYLKSAPPVDHEVGETRLSYMGKVILAAGGFGKDILPAEVINHTITTANVNVGYGDSTIQYGNYLVRVMGCRDCHGQDLTGGKSPAPDAPHAPDITSTRSAARTNQSTNMPWAMLKPLDDLELESILLYLKSLPNQ